MGLSRGQFNHLKILRTLFSIALYSQRQQHKTHCAIFDLFLQGGTSYAVYRRYASIQNYNQYADDVTDVNQGHTGADVGSGYIDYFNQPPAPVQSGFDASMAADDEFISGGGQHLAGDTELLTS